MALWRPPLGISLRAKHLKSSLEDYLLLRQMLQVCIDDETSVLDDDIHAEVRSLCQTARMCCLFRGDTSLPPLEWDELPQELRVESPHYTIVWDQLPPVDRDLLLVRHPKCRERWKEIKNSRHSEPATATTSASCYALPLSPC